MNSENEITKLDGTKTRFIVKGIIVGAVVGIVISLFRVLVEEVFQWVIQGYVLMQEQPLWLIPWTVVSL